MVYTSQSRERQVEPNVRNSTRSRHVSVCRCLSDRRLRRLLVTAPNRRCDRVMEKLPRRHGTCLEKRLETTSGVDLEISLEPTVCVRSPPAGGGAEPSGVRRCQSVPFPTYVTGPQPNGSWVVSDGADHHPGRHASQPRHPGPRQGHRAEPQRANSHRRRPHPGRVAEAVEVFDTHTGAVLQNYLPFGQRSERQL